MLDWNGEECHLITILGGETGRNHLIFELNSLKHRLNTIFKKAFFDIQYFFGAHLPAAFTIRNQQLFPDAKWRFVAGGPNPDYGTMQRTWDRSAYPTFGMNMPFPAIVVKVFSLYGSRLAFLKGNNWNASFSCPDTVRPIFTLHMWVELVARHGNSPRFKLVLARSMDWDRS